MSAQKSAWDWSQVQGRMGIKSGKVTLIQYDLISLSWLQPLKVHHDGYRIINGIDFLFFECTELEQMKILSKDGWSQFRQEEYREVCSRISGS